MGSGCRRDCNGADGSKILDTVNATYATYATHEMAVRKVNAGDIQAVPCDQGRGSTVGLQGSSTGDGWSGGSRAVEAAVAADLSNDRQAREMRTVNEAVEVVGRLRPARSHATKLPPLTLAEREPYRLRRRSRMPTCYGVGVEL